MTALRNYAAHHLSAEAEEAARKTLKVKNLPPSGIKLKNGEYSFIKEKMEAFAKDIQSNKNHF